MPQSPDVRWRQRFHSFCKAFAKLSAAAELAQQRKLSELERQGLIQAFEFTHELAWNETTADEIATAILDSFVAQFDTFRKQFARFEANEP